MRKKKLLAQANKKYYNVCSKGKKVRETEERNFIKWLSISDRYTKMHLDRHLAPLRLNSSQYMYVIKICQHPGMTQDQFQACSYLNPSNITRSIATLEKEGFIVSYTGKGSFVARQNTEFLREDALRRVEQALENAVDIARHSGISDDEVRQALSLLLEGV